MYLKFFNLTAKPFEISPDPRFLWLGEKHKEGLASLKYGILRGKGFMALTGDVGTGKTTLLNALVRSFDDNFVFAKIPDPYLEELDFFNLTASAFEMGRRFHGKGDFLTELSIFLNQAHADQKEIILIVDEAQRITPEVLEDIRLISNIEKPEKKLINIIFSGQINFNEILNDNKALRTRLAIYYKIDPLTETETEAYITHRLNVAGSYRRIFSSNAIHEIYALSNGNPRQINIICDLSLLHAYSAESVEVDAGIVKECSKRAVIPVNQTQPLVEYVRNQTIVPLNQIREEPSGEVPRRTWGSRINGIKAVLNRHKIAYLAPVPLIILISLIGILFYPDSFFSSVSKFKLQLRQTINRYVDSDTDDNSYQAQVVNVLSPNQSDPAQEELALKLEDEKNRNEELTRELAARTALIADLQKKLEKAGSEIAKQKKHLHINRQATALLKTQVKEINALKAASDARLEELQTANAALTADLERLQPAGEQHTRLSGKLTALEQQLAQGKKRQKDLETELAQSQKNNEQLNDELLAQTTQVAELKKQIGASKEAQTVLEAELKKQQGASEQLRVQLNEANSQKASSKTRLAVLQTAHDELVVKLEEMNRLRAEVFTLNQDLARKEEILAERDKAMEELETRLAREQGSKDDLDGKLSAQSAKVSELQKDLNVSGEAKIALENELQASRREIDLLRTRLKEVDAQEASSADRLANLQTANESLMVDLELLKNAEAEVAELKSSLAEKDRLLTQRQERQQEIENALARKQKSNSELKTEMSSQAAEVAELKSSLAEKDRLLTQRQVRQQEIENALVKTQKGNAELKAQLSTQAASVAELQKKLEAARAEKVAGEQLLLKSRQETVSLQARIKELETQKASSESQFNYLQTTHSALTADFEELKKNREQVAELKHAVTIKDRIIDQKDQQQEELERNLDQAQQLNDKLADDISQQKALVADLQKNLDDARSAQIAFEGQLKENQGEMERLETRIKELGTQKASASDRMANLQSDYNDLKVEFEKLRKIQDRAIELENALGARDEKLMQSEQRQRDLETDLSRTQKQEEYLKREIASQAALIAELQDNLETARSDQASAKQQLQKSRQETALLQRQLNDLEKKQALRASSPPKSQTQPSSRSTAGSRKVEAEAPSPVDIIDWVIKKKSE